MIPARGGSKRIPRKNIRSFLGEPIISYAIRAALKSGLFDEVMVSTDDQEIADVARAYGASVPFMRSADTANDTATTSAVLLEVTACYQERGRSFPDICCLYPTTPMVNAQLLHEAYTLWQTSQMDALIPVVAFSYPPFRGCIIEGDALKLRWPEHADTRTQDLPPLYHDAGAFYFIKTEALINERTLWCKRVAPMVLRDMQVQDIDCEEDWCLAELKYKLLNGGS